MFNRTGCYPCTVLPYLTFFPVCFTLAAAMDIRWQWHCVCGLGEQPKEVGYHVLYQPQVSDYQSHWHASMDAVLENEYCTDVL